MSTPEQIATVVFADLVGSTGIFETLGDQTASRFVTQLTGALSGVFQHHHGRVVKLLGDGIFAVFAHEEDALAACVAIQERLRDKPIAPQGLNRAVQMQMGIESGEVVEIDGDCFGDAVNSAARLADLAGAGQIFSTQRVRDALPAHRQVVLKSLGPIYLRGKAQPIEVYSAAWDVQHDNDATVMGVSIVPKAGNQTLALHMPDREKILAANGVKVTMGRASDADMVINDTRVSRVHATAQWRSGYFVLEDTSSYGTWVYMAQQSEAVVLRRTECYLIGSGTICLGCEQDADNAVRIAYSVNA